MNKLQTLVENVKKNIWTTILVALTVLTQILEMAKDTLDFEALGIAWLPGVITLVTFIKIVYEKFILPNFSEPEALDLLKYSRENQTMNKLNDSVFDNETLDQATLLNFRRSKL